MYTNKRFVTTPHPAPWCLYTWKYCIFEYLSKYCTILIHVNIYNNVYKFRHTQPPTPSKDSLREYKRLYNTLLLMRCRRVNNNAIVFLSWQGAVAHICIHTAAASKKGGLFKYYIVYRGRFAAAVAVTHKCHLVFS